MELKEYVSRAKVTESIVPAIKADAHVVEKIFDAVIAAGNLLDMVKKNALYREYKNGEEIIKRPHDQDKWSLQVELLQRSADELSDITHMSLVENFYDDPLPVNTRLFHAIVGIATEATELVEALRNGLVTGDDLDEINIQEELGDLAWYQAIAVDEVQTDWGKLLETNITKLEARNKGKAFNADATVNRDVVAERQLLEECDARAKADYFAWGGQD